MFPFICAFERIKQLKGFGEKQTIFMDHVFIMSCVQFVLASYIYFICFYSRTSECWNKVGPVFHFIFALVVFVMIPIAGMAYSITYMVKGVDLYDKTYLGLYLTINIQILFNFASLVLKVLRQTFAYY